MTYWLSQSRYIYLNLYKIAKTSYGWNDTEDGTLFRATEKIYVNTLNLLRQCHRQHLGIVTTLVGEIVRVRRECMRLVGDSWGWHFGSPISSSGFRLSMMMINMIGTAIAPAIFTHQNRNTYVLWQYFFWLAQGSLRFN